MHTQPHHPYNDAPSFSIIFGVILPCGKAANNQILRSGPQRNITGQNWMIIIVEILGFKQTLPVKNEEQSAASTTQRYKSHE